MKKGIIALCLFSTLPLYAASLSDAETRDLMKIGDSVNSCCRGLSPDADPYAHPALCGDDTKPGARDRIVRVLKNHKWCYGKKNRPDTDTGGTNAQKIPFDPSLSF